MTPYQPGDKSAAICEHCRKKVVTRFEPRTFAMDDGRKFDDLLVGVCVECGEIASVPDQSARVIRGGSGENNGTL